MEPSETTRLVVENGEFFIISFEIQQGILPPMENALYGETQGDTLNEDEIFLMERGDRGLKNRMIHRPMRLCWHGHAIGLKKENGFVEFFTIHGGDLAPKHPDTCESVEEKEYSLEWWSKHALATGKSMVRLKITEQSTLTHVGEHTTTVTNITKYHDWVELPINIDMDIEEQVLSLYPDMIGFIWEEK